MNKEFIKGIDVSSYLEYKELGARYFLDKEEKDLFEICKINGINSLRIRLWVNPFSEDGKPFKGGTNDLKKAIKLSLIGKSYGFSIMLDFHYSDFWCDPSKQTLPRSFIKLMDKKSLEEIVYEYTSEVLNEFKKNHIDLAYIQVGNEITNGFLWPYGRLYKDDKFLSENVSRFVSLLSSGIKACRKSYGNSKIILHLERSGFTEIMDKLIGIFKDNNIDYDILGLSYYPYWHKNLPCLEKTLSLIKEKYNKDFMIVETSFGYSKEEVFNGEFKEPLVIDGECRNITTPIDYEISLNGQIKFLKDLFALVKKYDGLGIYYWEPAMIKVKGFSWASKEAMDYIKEYKKEGNEWVNQCLFDENGNALDSLKIIKEL